MIWTAPTLVEICIGLEINGYLPAEFWLARHVGKARRLWRAFRLSTSKLDIQCVDARQRSAVFRQHYPSKSRVEVI